jgi:coenzyme F420-reducing hydrogenase beta subunit
MDLMTIGITAADFAGNKGAAAMLQSIIKNIEKEYPEVEFKLFSVYPDSDKLKNPYYNLEVVDTRPEKIIFVGFPLAMIYKIFGGVQPFKALLLKNEMIKGFVDCDLVVDAAGVSFIDSRGFIMNTYNFICAAVPMLTGNGVIKFSQATGPYNNITNRTLAKLVLPRMYSVNARGTITKDHLEGLGLNNVRLCADGAFLMPDDQAATEYVKNLIATEDFYNMPYISLSVSSVVYKYCEENDIDYITTMVQFIEYLNNNGYGVLLIANAARAGKEKLKNNDLPICREIMQSFEGNGAVKYYDEEFTPEIIREFISHSEILVASRFHSMIGGLEKGVPTLLVGWSHKYKEVLDMFELGENALDFKQLQLDTLIEEFKKIEKDKDKIREQILYYLPEVKEMAYRNFKAIFEYIEQYERVNKGIVKQLEPYYGESKGSYMGYTKDENIRKNAASGGMITQLLVHLVETKKVDGVLVSKQYVEEGDIKVNTFIAKTKDEIIDCSTSIYTYFPIEKSLKDIIDLEGNIAVVVLPCHLKVLNALYAKNPAYKKKVKYTFTLFCGGVADKKLMKKILEINNIDIKDVKRIHSRKGHWRGNTIIEMKDGSEKQISYKYNWSTYKNAYYYSTQKCFSCQDHFGFTSDISFGDIWLKEMKDNPIKHTAMIARTDKGKELLYEVKNREKVELVPIKKEKIIKGNKRSLVYKFLTAYARQQVGKKKGYIYNGEPLIKNKKWSYYLVAYFIIKNMERSKDDVKMESTFRRNKKLMFLYMCAIRFFLSF